MIAGRFFICGKCFIHVLQLQPLQKEIIRRYELILEQVAFLRIILSHFHAGFLFIFLFF